MRPEAVLRCVGRYQERSTKTEVTARLREARDTPDLSLS